MIMLMKTKITSKKGVDYLRSTKKSPIQLILKKMKRKEVHEQMWTNTLSKTVFHTVMT